MCANSGAVSTGFICQDAEIANNTIYNTTSIAINIKYGQNSNISVPDAFRIHNNTIYDFMRRSGDSGAIDAAGSDLQWTRIDHNTIYNTTPATGQMTHGIYLDYAGSDNLSRTTIDHNVIYDVPVPVLISSTRFVNVYNNVLLSHPLFNLNCIVNWGGSLNGIDDKIYNNIMSKEPGIVGTPSLLLALISNNITNASGTVLTDLFVNPAAHDYHLKSTATAAIDKGKSVGVYDENVVALPDLGAYEFGTIADAIAPSAPTGLSANTISDNSFSLSWTASTDNVQVTGYRIYLNGSLADSTSNTSIVISKLIAATSYSVTVKARDFYNNTSESSSPFTVTTIAYPGRTLHLEAKNNSARLGGSISSGVWTGYKTGSYLQFNGVSLSQQTNFKVYLSCTSAGAQLEVRLDSPTGSLLGTLTVSSTGNIATFEAQNSTLSETPIGVYNLFIVAKNTVISTCKLDWIEISGGAVVGQIPTQPLNLRTSFTGDSRISLTWIGSIDDKAVTGYEVFKDGVSTVITKTNSLLLEGLKASTKYVISVRAFDADGNYSEESLPLEVTTNLPKLTGLILGTDGTWGSNDDKTVVFDGNINTAFDSTTPDFAWAGLELNTAKIITGILFYPRINGAQRMVKGEFQASNSADFSTDVVTLYTVASQPSEEWHGYQINNPAPYKYVRYKSPVGGYGNIAEVEFYGSDVTATSTLSVNNEFQVFPNPASDQLVLKNLEMNSKITITAMDGKTIYKNANSVDGDFKLSVADWNRGIYLIRVQNGSKSSAKKVVLF
jgi:chitodextrinase